MTTTTTAAAANDNNNSNNDEKEKKKKQKQQQQQQQQQGGPLPTGWKSAVDPSSIMTYYYHRASGRVSWDKPKLVAAERRTPPPCGG